MVEVHQFLAMNNSLFVTVSNISAAGRLVLGILLLVAGSALLRFAPTLHEKYFGQFKSSVLQTVGGPAFVIVIGVVLIIGGMVQLF